MKYLKLLLIFLLFATTKCFAHKDFFQTRNFSNVKVRIKTGFRYEEIKKAWIIGELAANLCKELNYNDTVFLNFNHAYTGYCEPDQFMSFSNATIIYNWPGGDTITFLKQNALTITEVSRVFDAARTLQLLEYGIENLADIKAKQQTIVYEKNYCQWRIKTIALNETKNITSKRSSATVTKILKAKVFRETEADAGKDELTYYFQNGTYHVTDASGKEINCPSGLKNIYQFIPFPSNEAIIFDTDSSFYYFRNTPADFCSKKYIVASSGKYFMPVSYQKKNSNTIVLKFGNFRSRPGNEKEVFYRTDVDKLVKGN